jgi:nucleotide-binding universal stress UspA family protein
MSFNREAIMIKDVLVNLSVNGKPDPAMGYAISVATTFSAHLSAVVYDYELMVPGVVFDGGFAAGLIDAQRQESEQAAIHAGSRFEERSRLAGLAADIRKVAVTVGEAAEHLQGAARVFDLSIIGQPEPDEGSAFDLLVEAALFGSGRPIIVVPYIHKGGLTLDRVTVCWDGGRAAARAIADAAPFLKKSKVVELLMVETEQSKSNEMPGADMAQHLARHGLQVELNRITSPDIDVADAILSHVTDNSSDLLVMGAYGHSRLREFVLGGVTRSVLKQMTLPALMSH